MAAKLSKKEWEDKINASGIGRYEFVKWSVDGEYGYYSTAVCKCIHHDEEMVNTAGRFVEGLVCKKCKKPHARVHGRSSEDWINIVNDSGSGRYRFVRWCKDGEFGSVKKALLKCLLDGHEWEAKPNNLVNGRGCPKCAKNIIRTPSDWIDAINDTGHGRHFFVSWDGEFRHQRTRAICECEIDGFRWSSNINMLVNNWHGCPQCAGNRRYTESEYEELIKGSGAGKFDFIGWVGKTRRSNSKVYCKCYLCDKIWDGKVTSLVNKESGCPYCKKVGYNHGKDGTLYALRSACGTMIKVGISNAPHKRHRTLRRCTPFSFDVIEQISGDGRMILDLETHFHRKYKSAKLSGFDGATEWLVCTDELLQELRNTRDSLHQGV